MKFGVCCPIDQAPMAVEAGYDYIELSASHNLLVDKADWPRKRAEIRSLGRPVESLNSFVNGGMIVGPSADRDWLHSYAGTVIERAAQIGVEVVVLGSGRARSVPDGFPRDRAERQMLDFVDRCAGVAEPHGIVIAIEPLQNSETNLINRVGEAADLSAIVGRSNVGIVADSYHMARNGEPASVIRNVANQVRHVHVADTGRGVPGTGQYDFSALFTLLHEIGYTGRMSVECRMIDPSADFRTALSKLRGCREDVH